MRLTLFLCLMSCPAALVAQGATMTSPAIASLETGVICPPPSVGESEAPGTLAGTTHLIEEEPPFVSKSNGVPAVIGIGFGAKSMTADLFGLQDVTMTVTHPPMGKDGITSQTFQTRIDGTEPSLTFYQFDFAYELVQGEWQMEASKDGDILFRTTFEVVAPGTVPELARICGFEDLLS
ncbi:DUF3859 domain-containing protein [Loktanella sp. M215]|uniref:DUF3859 domain-containing protein n=1 Tax=Loktanella sp. M215 TaxID=2675431 RepID=UPI001F3D8A53|nr:DUF3859 domain-containing protein [Loktanella sp. M215]MCF7698186.1 DUF3859 domain-containing protein [Loktanella sp. M215]